MSAKKVDLKSTLDLTLNADINPNRNLNLNLKLNLQQTRRTNIPETNSLHSPDQESEDTPVHYIPTISHSDFNAFKSPMLGSSGPSSPSPFKSLQETPGNQFICLDGNGKPGTREREIGIGKFKMGYCSTLTKGPHSRLKCQCSITVSNPLLTVGSCKSMKRVNGLTIPPPVPRRYR